MKRFNVPGETTIIRSSRIINQIKTLTVNQSLRFELIRGGIGCTVIKVLNALLSLSLTIVLARVLGSDQYGVYAYLFALISILSLPVQFGLPTLIMRETAKAKVNENWSLLRGVWRWATAIAVSASILIGLSAAIIAWYLLDETSERYFNTLIWALILLPFLALGKLRDAALRGLSRVVQGQLSELIIRPALLLILIFSISLANTDLNASHAMALHALAAGTAFIIGTILLRLALPTPLRNRPIPTYNSKLWAYSAVPLAFSAGMQLVNQHTDIMMLGFYVPDNQIGIYNIAVKCSILLSFGFQIINMIVVPYFSKFYNQGEFKKLQRLVLISSRITLATTAIATIVIVLFGQRLLNFAFGPEYQSALLPLIILCVGQIVNATAGPAGSLLNMTNNEKSTATALAFSAVSNIALNTFLIPFYQLTGAAIATSTSMALLHITLWVQAMRRTTVNTSPFQFQSLNSGLR